MIEPASDHLLDELNTLLATQGRLQFAKQRYDEAQATRFGIALLDFMRVHGMELRRRLTAAPAAPVTNGCGCPCEPSGTDGLRCPSADGTLLCRDEVAAPAGAQAVAWRYRMPLGRGIFAMTRWLGMDQPRPDGCKIEYAYSAPPEPQDAEDAARYRFAVENGLLWEPRTGTGSERCGDGCCSGCVFVQLTTEDVDAALAAGGGADHG